MDPVWLVLPQPVPSWTYYIILLINVIASQNKYIVVVNLDDASSSPQDFIKRCWQKRRIQLRNDTGEKQSQHAEMPPVYMQMQREKGATCIPSYFTAKCSVQFFSAGVDKMKWKRDKVLGGFTMKKMLLANRKNKDKKGSALKGLGPLSHPSPLSLADAYGSNAYGGRSSENPLSPLEGPTFCQGAQGAQWTLVNAFQESGSGERGGEVEGGFTLRNAARSWGDSHGTGRVNSLKKDASQMKCYISTTNFTQ